MQRGNMNEEKEITESKISEMLSNLKTTEENERGKGNMNEEKEITESEINEMFLNLETSEERAVFLASSIYQGWVRKRNQRLFEDCAKIGLAQYNAQNGTNFELDKVCCEGHYFGPGFVYFHLNFIAESSDGSNDEKKTLCFLQRRKYLKIRPSRVFVAYWTLLLERIVVVGIVVTESLTREGVVFMGVALPNHFAGLSHGCSFRNNILDNLSYSYQ